MNRTYRKPGGCAELRCGDDGPVLDSRGDVFGVTQFGGTGGQGVTDTLE